MNDEQKKIIEEIKILVKKLDATIQEDRDEQVLRSGWINGQPKERPKRD